MQLRTSRTLNLSDGLMYARCVSQRQTTCDSVLVVETMVTRFKRSRLTSKTLCREFGGGFMFLMWQVFWCDEF